MSDVIYKHAHTFPVDPSFGETDEGVLAAWTEICNFGLRVTRTGEPLYAWVYCDGEVCWRIEDPDVTFMEIRPL